MKKNRILLLAILGLLSLSNHEAQAQVVEPVSFDQYRQAVNKIDIKAHTITLEKFEKDRLKSDVAILDLRSEGEYKQGHLKGALLMGADIKEEKLNKLVPNKKTEIIVYCTNTFFPSRRLSLNNVCLPQIITLGYPNTYVLEELWQKDMGRMDKLKTSGLWESETTH